MNRQGHRNRPIPSHDFALNTASLAVTLLAWLKLLALNGDLPCENPRPSAMGTAPPARLTRSGWRRQLKIPATGPWRSRRHRLDQDRCPATSLLTSKTSCDHGRNPLGPWNSRPPGPPAGVPSHPGPKSRSYYAARLPPQPATGPHELSGLNSCLFLMEAVMRFDVALEAPEVAGAAGIGASACRRACLWVRRHCTPSPSRHGCRRSVLCGFLCLPGCVSGLFHFWVFGIGT